MNPFEQNHFLLTAILLLPLLGALAIALAPNPDILAEVAALPGGPFCVGFAAETENLKAYATEKRRRKGIPLLAANLATETFGRDDNALILFDDAGEHELARAPKQFDVIVTGNMFGDILSDEAAMLTDEGRRLCSIGHNRAGIMRLRRALSLLSFVDAKK